MAQEKYWHNSYVIEFIEKRGDYRVYDPIKPEQTIAYEDSVEAAKKGIEAQLETRKVLVVDSPMSNRTDKFLIVKEIPDSRYIVWNIGNNMADGYLPLCRLLPEQEDWQMNIDPSSLVAIDMSDRPKVLAEMRRAASYGVVSLETAQKYAFAKEPPANEIERGQRAYAKDLLPVFEELSPNFVDRMYGR